MFVYVEPLFFHTGCDAQAMYDVKSFEDHESHEGGPASDYGGSEKLCQQEVCTARVEKALFGGKQSGQYGSEESADTVYGRGSAETQIQLIILLQSIFLEVSMMIL